MSYSVLMSVYAKERPEFLDASMQSIQNQTLKTNDFVLVCDGPLTEGLEKVIAKHKNAFGDVLNLVRLEKNQGLGSALNSGIKYCRNELVARMDSDDICKPERCEKQVMLFETNPDLGICSSIIEEFSCSVDTIEAVRAVPERHNDIVSFAKYRSPFNHPCVMYKKSVVERAGGYEECYLMEDYFLWLRILKLGVVGYNFQESLLYARSGNGMHKRRGGLRYAKSLFDLCYWMYRGRMINSIEFFYLVSVKMIVACLPNWIRKLIYVHLLRRRPSREM